MRFKQGLFAGAIWAASSALPSMSTALDRLDFNVAGGNDALARSLRQASLLVAQKAEGRVEGEDLFTAARADYGRLLGALYAEGYYSAVIHILMDGKEAASIAPLDAPTSVSFIKVDIHPGPPFFFSDVKIAPLAPQTELPYGFQRGEIAKSGQIETAAVVAQRQWRERSHAKVAVSKQDILVNHQNKRVSADIGLTPGPALRFGPITVAGAKRMDVRRILKIAGLPEGAAFSESELNRAANRLRRSGVFSSVTMTEADRIVGGDLLPIHIEVAEQKPRRYSLGGEVSSIDGFGLTGHWLHRNLLGGGERLSIDALINNIGADGSGIDYELGVKIERPATLTADTTAGLVARLGRADEIDYAADYSEFGLTFTQYWSEELTLNGGFSLEYVEGVDPQGAFLHKTVTLPLGVIWDRRDNHTDAKRGFYIEATAKPFLGIDGTGSGLRSTADLRGYRSVLKNRLTFAARLQGGAILGSKLLDAPRDDLFFIGGGGTVRGQPYRSLGVAWAGETGEEFEIGGLQYAASSLELRARFGEAWGAVAFVDAGWVGAEHEGASHAGAGLGLRYETGFGPIRFDIAAPVHGDTGEGAQIYIGLGQAF